MINQWVSSVTSCLFYSPHDGNESNYPQVAVTAVQSDQLFYVRAKRRKLIDHLSLEKRKVKTLFEESIVNRNFQRSVPKVGRNGIVSCWSLLPATCYE